MKDECSVLYGAVFGGERRCVNVCYRESTSRGVC